MVYTRNDVIQEIVPFFLQVNANAFLTSIDRADFLTMIVLAKLENVFAINCSDVVAFTQVSTKRKVTTSKRSTFKRSELGSPSQCTWSIFIACDQIASIKCNLLFIVLVGKCKGYVIHCDISLYKHAYHQICGQHNLAYFCTM